MTEIAQVNFRIYFNSTQTKAHFISNYNSLYSLYFLFLVRASSVCTHESGSGIQIFSWHSDTFEFAFLALVCLFAWFHCFPYFTKEKGNQKMLKTTEDVFSFWNKKTHRNSFAFNVKSCKIMIYWKSKLKTVSPLSFLVSEQITNSG